MKKLASIVICLCMALAGVCCTQKPPHPYDNKSDVMIGSEELEMLNLKGIATPYYMRRGMSFVAGLDTLERMGLDMTMRYNQKRYYSVSRLEEATYLFLLFEDMGEKKQTYMTDGFLVKAPLADKDSFLKAVTLGADKEEVLKADPNAYIDIRGKTFHRFYGKPSIMIDYEGDKVVSIIETEDESVLDYLISKDIAAISE